MCKLTHNLHRSPNGFSLIELVMVIVIIGVIGAIAIPRMSSAADNAAKNAVVGDHSTLQKALDLYETEHEGVKVHVGAGGLKTIYFRLLKKSDLDGTVNPSGIYGPYINGIPANKINGLNAIRRNGAAAGANTHGWRYDTATGRIEPDHTAGATGRKGGGKSLERITDELIQSVGG